MLFVSKKEIRDGREGTKVCKRQLNDTEKIFAEPHLTLLLLLLVADARSCSLEEPGGRSEKWLERQLVVGS